MPDVKKTILSIDDDITILNAIRTILEGTYEVSLAKNTGIAQTILNTTRVDLILLDMNMPGTGLPSVGECKEKDCTTPQNAACTSGMDFLEFVRNDDSHYRIPVIIVSSQGTPDVIKEIKKRGAVDFVVKPISPNILLEKIHSNLKTGNVKISRDYIEGKLKRLIAACNTGKSSQVEKIVNGLQRVHCEQKIDAKIAEICKYAKDMEYNLVEEKAGALIAEMSELPE
ncbi:MAG: response regulator [Treponema sp.]|nr:response regulator [Treponema sp.]